VTPADLAGAVVSAIRAAVAAGELSVTPPDSVVIERPKNPAHGDYATNVALVLAKSAGRPPREVAEIIATRLRQTAGIDAVDIAGPGFLNIRLSAAAHGELARLIVHEGAEYGRSDAHAKERINLEFVSANPTGPVTLASTRWAAVGDALARLLRATGHDVGTEYYFNDAGSQVEHFGASVLAAAKGDPTPPDGYAGEYVKDVAREVVASHPDLTAMPEAEALTVAARTGIELMLAEIKATLGNFGVDFDVWFTEQSLHESGALETALERLRAGGHVYEKDGAVWLRTTEVGDYRDRVLVRSNGRPAYELADCAYYLDKRERGFDRCIYILGADHHDYVAFMRGVAACFGDDPDATLEIILGQLVNLFRDGEPVRMSKRAGNFITLEDLVEAVGVDAARYSLVRSSTDSTLDLDLDLISRQSSDNPVFYVQYAHARVSSLLRNAASLGIERGTDDGFDPTLLVEPQEGLLLGSLGEFPRVVTSAAELREPHRVARYLEELAGTYHRFYDACRVLPMADEPATSLTHARLWLVEATRIVLSNGLGLLGVSAPERM
jgi:arginyl-tRNA synthetase